MTSILFVHGVPDTAAMWSPLIAALNLPAEQTHAVCLPGFGCARPSGFAATKDGYAAWLIAQAEQLVADHGAPIHIVGHDWGAILTVRVAMLRPELFASWTTANGFAGPGKHWHSLARKWQTPIIGELTMLMMKRSQLSDMLQSQGMDARLANEEVRAVDGTMKRAILSLYRSAKTLSVDWPREFDKMPKQGLLVWGTEDPFAPLRMAEKFCSEHDVPLHKEEGAGHWAIVERAAPVAERLKTHWGL